MSKAVASKHFIKTYINEIIDGELDKLPDITQIVLYAEDGKPIAKIKGFQSVSYGQEFTLKWKYEIETTYE